MIEGILASNNTGNNIIIVLKKLVSTVLSKISKIIKRVGIKKLIGKISPSHLLFLLLKKICNATIPPKIAITNPKLITDAIKVIICMDYSPLSVFCMW